MWTRKIRSKGGLGLELSFERFDGGGTSDVALQLVPQSELTERAWPPSAVPSRIRNEQGYL